MKTIVNDAKDELIISKSRFIGCLYKVNDINEINNILDKLKKEYPLATHICYSYSLINSKKAFDDGEPNGTAGIPILEIFNKLDLVNVLGVVIRYFGGIKLGSGGLIRAYSNAIRNTLNKTKIKELKKGYLIKITFDYSINNLINNLLDNYEVVEKEFNELITSKFKADEELLKKLKDINQPYEIIEEIYL